MSKNGNNVKITTEFQFPQPKQKISFCQFMYNKDEGTFCGRTPESWGRIILFYIIFYIVLAGLFTICLQGLYSTLSLQEPKWKLDESLIGTNPGLGFRPISSRTERGSVIQFDTKKPAEGKFWQNLLDEFLIPYRAPGRQEKFCNFNKTTSDHQVCAIDMSQFGPCSPENGYGYKNGRPCVFLKLNKIFNWVPEYYDDPSDLPEDMPQDLKDHIASKPLEERKQVWVTCNGLNNVDREKLGRMKYFPSQGFPSFFYPFVNQKTYLSPLIAVQFENVKINDFVGVECRAWARNIEYSGSNRDRKGSVTFVLYID